MNNYLYMRKGRLVVVALLLLANFLVNALYAQTNSAAAGRNSITVLFLNYSSGDPIESSVYNKYQMPARFDINDIGTRYLDVPVSFSQSASASLVEEQIQSQQIPNKILRSILVNDNLGYMTTETLEDRGLYSATDADVVSARNSARGLNILRDNGAALMNNIYFVVVSPESLNSSYEKNTGATAYSLAGSTYLYKLDISSMIQSNEFWDRFYFDKPDQAMLDKLMNYEFPIKRVYTASYNTLGTDLNAAGKIGIIGNFVTQLSTGVSAGIDVSSASNFKSPSEIHTDLLTKAMARSFEQFESLLGGFSIKQSVFSARPLLVKIGKKESLRPDDLFEVTERVVNTRTGVTSTKRVGFIRARRVARNQYQSKGKTAPSSFYRVATHTIRKGMEITKVREPRYNIGFSYHNEPSSILGGYYLNIEYITHWWAGMRVGFDVGYNAATTSAVTDYTGIAKFKGNFSGDAFTGILSLKPSINFHRLSVIPIGGIYYSYIPISGSTILDPSTLADYNQLQSTELGAVYGGDLGFNISKILQLRAGYRKTYPFYNISKDESDSFAYTLHFDKPTFVVGIRLFGL